MMILILDVLTDMLLVGLLFYIGYQIGYNHVYKKGRKNESDYWYRTCWKVNKKGSM